MATFTYALGAAAPLPCAGGILTIGNFDGAHLGHQALLLEARSLAQSIGGPSIAVTFDPPPAQILRPGSTRLPLTTMADRAELLHHYGIEHVLILQTAAALLDLSAPDFFHRIVVECLHAKAMVEGFNFAFGKNRSGTLQVLQSLCAEHRLQLKLAPPCEVLGQPVSSSRIRSELLAGNVDVAASLIGRPYRIAGIVGTGAKRGSTLGFPTANLEGIPTLLPGNAVYAGLAHVDETHWPAAINLGPNPTFGENARKIEVHLIGWNAGLYGKSLNVDFIRKVRDVRSFKGIEELKTQIFADVEAVKKTVTDSNYG